MKLLISARDAGAANNLAPVAQLAEQDTDIKLKLVASDPAYSIFKAHNLNVQPIENNKADLLDTARALLKTYQPDAVLVGLSGPDAGIDEALLAIAHNVPTFALQDFWGDVNNGFGHYASTYLVRDALAEKLTQQRAQVKTAVTGSPNQQKNLPAYKIQQSRNRIRQRHKIPASTPIVSLCLQPLWEEDGYQETLREALQALPPCKLFVRLHPRNSQKIKRGVSKLLNRHCNQPWYFSEDHLDEMLAASDLLLSAFSNCSLDLAYLNRTKKTASSVPLYLMHNKPLHQLYQEWTGLATLPLSDIGVSRTVLKRTHLKHDIKQSLWQKIRYRCGQQCSRLKQVPDAAEKIIDVLRHQSLGTE